MANNTFLLFLLAGAVVLGALGGYFVFLGVYQEQDRITLENFEAAVVTLQGTVKEASDNAIKVQREKTSYLIHITQDTLFLTRPELREEIIQALLEQGRPPLEEETALGDIKDIQEGTRVEVTADFRNGSFTAFRVVLFGVSAK